MERLGCTGGAVVCRSCRTLGLTRNIPANASVYAARPISHHPSLPIMSWTDHTLNPEAVLAYYGDAPRLDGLTLHSLSLLRDGPVAELVLEPSAFPTSPSKRWPEGSNRCQITLRAIAVEAVRVDAWGTGVVGDLEVIATSKGIQLSFEGDAKFTLLCRHLQVATVTGYVVSEA